MNKVATIKKSIFLCATLFITPAAMPMLRTATSKLTRSRVMRFMGTTPQQNQLSSALIVKKIDAICCPLEKERAIKILHYVLDNYQRVEKQNKDIEQIIQDTKGSFIVENLSNKTSRTYGVPTGEFTEAHITVYTDIKGLLKETFQDISSIKNYLEKNKNTDPGRWK